MQLNTWRDLEDDFDEKGSFFKKDPFYRGIYKSSFRLLRCSEYTDGCIEQGRKIKNRILFPVG